MGAKIENGIFPWLEFDYNNSYQVSIRMTPLEALYGRPYGSPSSLLESSKCVTIGSKMVKEAIEKVKLIQTKIKVT